MEEQNQKGEDKVYHSWSEKRRDGDDDASQREIKRRRGKDPIERFTDDIFEEIMLRLSVKSLLRLQIVSKHWRGMITSNSFKERYMQHQKNQEPKFLSVYEDSNWWRPNLNIKMMMRVEWSSASLVEEEEEEEEEYHIRVGMFDRKRVSGSVDGLLCIYSFIDWRNPIQVINLATRWSMTLPLATIQIDYENRKKEEFPRPGFGKDPKTGTYKLVLLHNVYNNDTSSCEVFDFGVKQWRQVIPPQMMMHNDQGPTIANGWLYWFTKDFTKLVAFDLHTEMFRVIPNPIISSSTPLVDMRMDCIDDGSRFVWISGIDKDGMQHFWRVTNNNKGGVLFKTDKVISLDLNKVNSTWFDTHDDSLLLYPMAISQSGVELMFAKPCSQKLLLLQPFNPNKSILYRMFSFSPSHPTNSLVVPYFPSLVSLS